MWLRKTRIQFYQHTKCPKLPWASVETLWKLSGVGSRNSQNSDCETMSKETRAMSRDDGTNQSPKSSFLGLHVREDIVNKLYSMEENVKYGGLGKWLTSNVGRMIQRAALDDARISQVLGNGDPCFKSDIRYQCLFGDVPSGPPRPDVIPKALQNDQGLRTSHQVNPMAEDVNKTKTEVSFWSRDCSWDAKDRSLGIILNTYGHFPKTDDPYLWIDTPSELRSVITDLILAVPPFGGIGSDYPYVVSLGFHAMELTDQDMSVNHDIRIIGATSIRHSLQNLPVEEQQVKGLRHIPAYAQSDGPVIWTPVDRVCYANMTHTRKQLLGYVPRIIQSRQSFPRIAVLQVHNGPTILTEMKNFFQPDTWYNHKKFAFTIGAARRQYVDMTYEPPGPCGVLPEEVCSQLSDWAAAFFTGRWSQKILGIDTVFLVANIEQDYPLMSAACGITWTRNAKLGKEPEDRFRCAMAMADPGRDRNYGLKDGWPGRPTFLDSPDEPMFMRVIDITDVFKLVGERPILRT